MRCGIPSSAWGAWPTHLAEQTTPADDARDRCRLIARRRRGSTNSSNRTSASYSQGPSTLPPARDLASVLEDTCTLLRPIW